jgi:sugar phosphate isomerase/epimerase
MLAPMDIDRISACTYAVRNESLDRAFGLVSASGFRKVDLWGGQPNYANDPAQCDIAAIRDKAASYGIGVANLGTYPGQRFLEDGLEAEMRQMRWAIDNAATLGARSIRVHPGSGEDPAIIPRLVPFFEQSARYAATRQVYLGMENHAGSLAGNPEAIMRLVAAVGSPWFGILFEPANLMHGKVDYRDAYRVFRGAIVHIHVKDSRWVDGAYERTMLGEGEIDYAWIIRSLEADGYRGDYALEYEIEDRYPIDEGLPKWLEHFRGL